MRAWILALAMMAMPAASAEQQQFDLVCTAKKSVVRYRIDLAANEWCLDRCRNINRIAAVTSGLITLYDQKAVTPNGPYSYGRINRLTGEWKTASWEPSYRSFDTQTGQCVAAPFSGFAAENRKF